MTTPANNRSSNLIWIDLEMTGLCTVNDTIIEIATIVTDKYLNELAEGPVFAVRQSQATLDGMDEWNTRQHGKSGLTARVLESGIDAAEAATATLAFLQKWVDPGASPMCGNSICQDRRFLAREMPELEEFFHYRNLDAKGYVKESAHLALSDIRDSIEELSWYRDNLFAAEVLDIPGDNG
jgi:oligoribonuclease